MPYEVWLHPKYGERGDVRYVCPSKAKANAFYRRKMKTKRYHVEKPHKVR